MGDDSVVDEKYRIMRPETVRPYPDPVFLLNPWPSRPIGREYGFIRTNDLPLYDNKALQLKRFVTVPDMSAMRDYTYRVRAWYLYKEMYLEAAVLSVWLTRHRVLFVQGGEKNSMKRNIAYASFSNDITGKWCQPTGDILIFPGLYQNLYFLKEAVLDLKGAMSTLRLLDKEISFDTAVGLSQQEVNDEYLKNAIIPTKLRAPREAPMVLVFKPIFCDRFYDMVFPKSRIIVEILQSSAMVFIKLTDFALHGKEIGAALCLVQNLQHYVSFLYNMLPDEDLKDYYTYTMTQWLVGRTYFEIYTRWNDTTDIESSYNKLKRRLTHVVEYAIPEGGLPRRIFPCELSTEFPRDRMKVLETCYITYNEISVPRYYNRSAYQKKTVRLMQLIALLKDWADGFIFPEKASVLNLICSFSIDDIHDEIERLRSFKYVNYDFKVMTNVLAAKYSRYRIATRSCVLVDDDSVTSYAIEAEKFCTKYHDRVRDAALKMLNENYVAKDCESRPASSEKFRSVLIKTAVRSLADEVVYGIDKLNYDPRSEDCVAALVNTLQKVVHVWFSPSARIDKKTKRIPSEEDKEFDFVMAMFLFGLASMHLLLLEETDEEQHLENSHYVFTLACQYLMRDTVAHRVLSAFVEHALMIECFFLVPSSERLWNRSKHSFAVIRRLVRLLPILFELCIHLGITDGPKDYYQVSIVMTKYPLSIELFKEKEFTASDSAEKMMDYILRDLNAELGKPFLAQKAEEGYDGPGTIYTYRIVPAQTQSQSVDSPPDEQQPSVPHYFFSPPLQGRDDCPYTHCPLEDYYLYDESKLTPVELFADEYFGQVLTDYEGAKPEYTNDYSPLLLKMKSLLKRVLDVVIEDLEEITRYCNLDEKEVIITTAMGGIPNGAETAYIPEHLRSELLVILDNLNQEDCPLLLCITRTLYRLDRLLDEGHVRTLFRGRLNLFNRD